MAAGPSDIKPRIVRFPEPITTGNADDSASQPPAGNLPGSSAVAQQTSRHHGNSDRSPANTASQQPSPLPASFDIPASSIEIPKLRLESVSEDHSESFEPPVMGLSSPVSETTALTPTLDRRCSDSLLGITAGTPLGSDRHRFYSTNLTSPVPKTVIPEPTASDFTKPQAGTPFLWLDNAITQIAADKVEPTPQGPSAMSGTDDGVQASLKGRVRLRDAAKSGGYGATLGAIVGGAVGTVVAGPLGTVCGAAAGAAVFGLIGMGCSRAVSYWRGLHVSKAARFADQMNQNDLRVIAEMEFADPGLTVGDRVMIREILREVSRHDLSTHHQFLMRAHSQKDLLDKREVLLKNLGDKLGKVLLLMRFLELQKSGSLPTDQRMELCTIAERDACLAGSHLFEGLLDSKGDDLSMFTIVNRLTRFLLSAKEYTLIRSSTMDHAGRDIPENTFDEDRDRLITKAWSESMKRLKPTARNQIFQHLHKDGKLRTLWEYVATAPYSNQTPSDSAATGTAAREFASLIRQIVLSAATGQATGADTLRCTDTGPQEGLSLTEIVDRLEREWSSQADEPGSSDAGQVMTKHPVAKPKLQHRRHDLKTQSHFDEAAGPLLFYLSFVQGFEEMRQVYQSYTATRDQHQRRHEAPQPVVGGMKGRGTLSHGSFHVLSESYQSTDAPISPFAGELPGA